MKSVEELWKDISGNIKTTLNNVKKLFGTMEEESKNISCFKNLNDNYLFVILFFLYLIM